MLPPPGARPHAPCGSHENARATSDEAAGVALASILSYAWMLQDMHLLDVCMTRPHAVVEAVVSIHLDVAATETSARGSAFECHPTFHYFNLCDPTLVRSGIRALHT